MRKIESIADEMRGVVTYEFKGGKRIVLDAPAVRSFGVAEILRARGYESLIQTERVAVMQHGRKVGTVPPDFEPSFIKSQSFLYDYRPGDFVRDGDVWVAANMLGPGDLYAVPGFEWDEDRAHR